ncbi:uncharacterized protein LOC144776629 [Lissotriton helveticus]
MIYEDFVLLRCIALCQLCHHHHPNLLLVKYSGLTGRARGQESATEETATSAQDQTVNEDKTPGNLDEDEESGPSGQLGQMTPVRLTASTPTPSTPAITPQLPEDSTFCVPSIVTPAMCPPQSWVIRPQHH